MSAFIVDFSSYKKSIPAALDLIEARELLKNQKTILIKPNLINDSKHPITTHPDCCEVLVQYIRGCSRAEIIIAEGCGEPSLETSNIFAKLGYTELAQRQGIELMDLNQEVLRELKNSNCTVFPEMYLPQVVFDCFLISVPVLKAHSLADITGSLKNMIGLAPPKYYGGRNGSWKKASFHKNIHQAILDLNQYRSPDLSLLDASIGMAEYHLGGPQCDPPVSKLISGFDPWEVDREAASLLGLSWKQIPHLKNRN
jgi:uncharacterized protein (DUF362 family)